MSKHSRKLKRTAAVLAVLTRYGFGELMSRTRVQVEQPSNALYERIRKVLEELGPTFVKFGQAFSTREDLLPLGLVAELKKLQDSASPEDMDIRVVLADELGVDPDVHFEQIAPEPMASASIAQVYRAWLKDGTPVILKVKRTGVREKMEADLLILKDLVSFMVNYSDTLRKMNLMQVLEAFEKSVFQELSLTLELANIMQFARNFKDQPDIYVAGVFAELSNDQVLCMEYIDGIKINNREALMIAGLDPVVIAQRGLDLFLLQVLEHGFFHADPHAGNILVLPNGNLSFIDFGAMGRMMPADKTMLENFILHFMAKDTRRLIATIKKMSLRFTIGDEQKLERDLHGIFEMLDSSALKDLDVKAVFSRFSGILNENEILMPDHLYLLVRGIVLMEGIGRELNPEMNVIQSVRPYLLKIVSHRLSPEHLMTKGIEQLRLLGEGISSLPEDLPALIHKLNSGELTTIQKISGLPELKKTLITGLNRVALAIVLAALMLAAVLYFLAQRN
ncbi:ubiquinone biosynthesis protein [bacterium A37T11]|nr:ubiquinone biosynthesis protein [bacterium A37T11]